MLKKIKLFSTEAFQLGSFEVLADHFFVQPQVNADCACFTLASSFCMPDGVSQLITYSDIVVQLRNIWMKLFWKLAVLRVFQQVDAVLQHVNNINPYIFLLYQVVLVCEILKDNIVSNGILKVWSLAKFRRTKLLSVA